MYNTIKGNILLIIAAVVVSWLIGITCQISTAQYYQEIVGSNDESIKSMMFASGFKETLPPRSKLSLNLVADSLVSAEKDGAIEKWPDKSKLRNDLILDSGNILARKSALNGYSSIVFDGASSFVRRNVVGSDLFSKPMTLVFVVKPDPAKNISYHLFSLE